MPRQGNAAPQIWKHAASDVLDSTSVLFYLDPLNTLKRHELQVVASLVDMPGDETITTNNEIEYLPHDPHDSP